MFRIKSLEKKYGVINVIIILVFFSYVFNWGSINIFLRILNSLVGSLGISMKWNIYGSLILFKIYFFFVLR